MLTEFIQTIKEHSGLIMLESSNSWTGINLDQPEPNIILDYLSRPNLGVDYLNANIASYITKKTIYEMKFASVFCHGKPQIRRTSDNSKKCKGTNPTERCELGDLIIQFILIDKDKKVKFTNAIILQAKKGDKADNKTQQCLYENDDRIIFPNYFGKADEECLLPTYEEGRTNALAYLFIEKSRIQIGQIPLAINLNFSWAHIINRILTNDIGKPFVYSDKNFSTDWDKLISKVIFNLSDSEYRKTKRVDGLRYFLDKFNYYYYYPEYFLESNNEGLPTIQIIIRHKEK